MHCTVYILHIDSPGLTLELPGNSYYRPASSKKLLVEKHPRAINFRLADPVPENGIFSRYKCLLQRVDYVVFK